MTRGVAHPPEFRAQVVAAVLAGMGINEAARQYGIDKATVSEWCSRAHVPTIPTVKTETDAELIMRYFRTAIRSMITQAEVFGDEQYCRRQDADKLAIAHGVLGDKFAGIATTAAALGLIAPAPGALELGEPDASFESGPADAAPGAADDDR
jgi:LPS sulfotransferase NodH